LPTAALNKEALIQELIAKEQIKEGPIALLSCVEPCLSFRVRSDHQTKMVHLVMESAKCTHLYHYYQHPEIGLMHIRVQTWFPFSVDVCLNGRQWLISTADPEFIPSCSALACKPTVLTNQGRRSISCALVL
jgi:hypothetical protein